jgi:hypothetical protein
VDDRALAEGLAGAGLACTPLSVYYAEPEAAARTGLVCGYSRLPETRADDAARLIARAAAAGGAGGSRGTGAGGRRAEPGEVTGTVR